MIGLVSLPAQAIAVIIKAFKRVCHTCFETEDGVVQLKPWTKETGNND